VNGDIRTLRAKGGRPFHRAVRWHTRRTNVVAHKRRLLRIQVILAHAVRSMALSGRGSLPGLGLNTSKHIREQEENDGAGRPPTEDADNDGLRRRDRKPDQSCET
jgi:hypothetical protein